MPPKKKKSGKKGKKSAKKSGRGSAKPPGEQLNELSKEYYLIQIRDLENRLVRLVLLEMCRFTIIFQHFVLQIYCH